MDYEPLNLSAFCNVGVDVYQTLDRASGVYNYPAAAVPPTGRQQYHGLPFQIGDGAAANCLVGLGSGLAVEPLTVPVGKAAHWLVFAHALLETDLWQGGLPGQVVASYRIFFDDSDPVTVPIRERYEVGNLPVPWGQFPFLALPDKQDYLEPRHEGQWGNFGVRLTETSEGYPEAYYLWGWKNPRPGVVITAVELIPANRRFILAGLTLSHVAENPFGRSARRAMKITLVDEADAAGPLDLSVEVDRGTATYVYPLPERPLTDERPETAGFGIPLNETNSPAYVEIAANPSATVAVRLGGEVVGQARWGDLEQGPAVENGRSRLEIIDPGRNWVKVEVVDEASGQALPCRVAFHSVEGVPYAPHGHHAPLVSNMYDWNMKIGGDLRLGHISYAYIDGRCEGWLPRGRVLVEVARGFEYEPLRQWVEIEPGQQRLQLKLKRWVDMNQAGYYSGDTHVHFLSPQASHVEAAAEDLNVVNLLQSQWGHYFSNTPDFTGRPSLSQDGRTIIYVSQENRQHMLGHLSLLGLKESVMPWCSGGAGESELGGSLETTLSHWADATHQQGGTVIIPHLPTPNGEPAALIATGRADAVEILQHGPYEHLEYYRYLNGGYRLPLVGGTDKMSSNVPVGLYRTYVYIPPDEPFTYDNWCRHLRGGHTFLSGGPLLWFTVEGQPIGSQLTIAGGGTVEVEATMRSIFPVHCLQIVQAGKVVAETADSKGTNYLQLKTNLKVTGDTWLAARCGGPDYTGVPHFDRRGRGIMAHTSPVYIQNSDSYALGDPATFNYMLTLVDGSIEYIRQQSHQYPAETTTHPHGQADHLAYLEAPFQEAREAIHRRLHQLGLAH